MQAGTFAVMKYRGVGILTKVVGRKGSGKSDEDLKLFSDSYEQTHTGTT